MRGSARVVEKCLNSIQRHTFRRPSQNLAYWGRNLDISVFRPYINFFEISSPVCEVLRGSSKSVFGCYLNTFRRPSQNLAYWGRNLEKIDVRSKTTDVEISSPVCEVLRGSSKSVFGCYLNTFRRPSQNL